MFKTDQGVVDTDESDYDMPCFACSDTVLGKSKIPYNIAAETLQTLISEKKGDVSMTEKMYKISDVKDFHT